LFSKKGLITQDNTYNVPELKFSEQAVKRQSSYAAWITKLKTILSMFPNTMNLIGRDAILPFSDPSCIENKAIFLRISSKVDAYFLKAIMVHEGKGDKALDIIKNQCAHLGAAGKHHYHHLFTTLCIRSDKSATIFFRRFTFARSASEATSNTYTEAELVHFALNGLSSTSNPKYEMALHLYNLQRDGSSIYTLANIETKFFTINEKVARDKTLTKLAIGHVASSNPHHPIKSTPRDPSKIICFNCGAPGHKSPDCPKGKGGEPKDNKVHTSANMARNNNNRPKKPRPRKKDSAQPAIVCSAHVMPLLKPSSPNSSVAHPLSLHDILIEQERHERATEKYPYSTVHDNAASRHHMQLHDKFVTLQFNISTNLDRSTRQQFQHTYLLSMIIHLRKT